MTEEDYECNTDTKDFNSPNFNQDAEKMEQQPLQQSIEQHGAGDGSNAQNSTNVISLARPEDDARKIFVGGLSWDTTTKELKDYFSQFGPVEETLIKQDPVTGRSRGFGFVLFENEESVINATEPSKKHTLLGKHIDPKAAKSKDKKDPITKIFVGGLDPELSQENIKEFFEKFGKVEQIDLPHDKTTNKRRAFAFVSFESEGAVEAVTATPKITIQGKEVDVKKATPHHQQAAYRARGGGGMRGGRGIGRGYNYQMNDWNQGNYGYDYNQSNYGWCDYPNNYSNSNYAGGDYAQQYGSYGNQGWGNAYNTNGSYGAGYDQTQNTNSNFTSGNASATTAGQQQRQWTTRS